MAIHVSLSVKQKKIEQMLKISKKSIFQQNPIKMPSEILFSVFLYKYGLHAHFLYIKILKISLNVNKNMLIR